ncbi:MAG: transglycosylase SLT domain-containing protein [Pseudomonadota bacterium]
MKHLLHILTKTDQKTVGLALLASLVFLSGCSSTPPPQKTYDNICSIFQHDSDWREAAQKSQIRWGTPPYVLMAMVHQESRFKPDAQPSRPYALGFIPLPRQSSAYGYSQAQEGTWSDYQKATDRWSPNRSDIEDSLDFMGWYHYQSHKRLKISRKDSYKLYLAYHEGQGGYSRRTYLKKPWLQKVAKKVADRSRMYRRQYAGCS